MQSFCSFHASVSKQVQLSNVRKLWHPKKVFDKIYRKMSTLELLIQQFFTQDQLFCLICRKTHLPIWKFIILDSMEKVHETKQMNFRLSTKKAPSIFPFPQTIWEMYEKRVFQDDCLRTLLASRKFRSALRSNPSITKKKNVLLWTHFSSWPFLLPAACSMCSSL